MRAGLHPNAPQRSCFPIIKSGQIFGAPFRFGFEPPKSGSEVASTECTHPLVPAGLCVLTYEQQKVGCRLQIQRLPRRLPPPNRSARPQPKNVVDVPISPERDPRPVIAPASTVFLVKTESATGLAVPRAEFNRPVVRPMRHCRYVNRLPGGSAAGASHRTNESAYAGVEIMFGKPQSRFNQPVRQSNFASAPKVSSHGRRQPRKAGDAGCQKARRRTRNSQI